MKNTKSGISNFLTLGLIVIGVSISLLTSFLITKQKSIPLTSRALNCPTNQCPGLNSCFNIGYSDVNSGLTCCAAFTNCSDTSFSWATWGPRCNCTAPTPTSTPTPIPVTPSPFPTIIDCTPNIRKSGSPANALTCSADICPPDQYVANSQQIVGTTRHCCCQSTGPTSTPTKTPTPIITMTTTPGPSRRPTPTLSRTPTHGPSLTPNPTNVPTLTTSPSQICHLNQEIYSIGQSYCDEPNNIVRKCLGNDRWQQISPNPCGTSNCVNDPIGHAYSCKAKCEALVDNGSNKLKVAFLPENYANSSEFRSNALNAIDQIKKTNLGSLVNKMNFYVVNDFSQSYHDPPYRPFEGVQFRKIHDTGQSVCGANSSIVIDNPAKCGDGGGVAVTGLSSYACGSPAGLVPHELGHSIASLEDEYGDANSSQEGSYLPQANCSDDPSCSKWKGMTDVGCYQGCGTGSPPNFGFKNWYRPTEISIMRDIIVNEFNPPSLKAWEDLLKKF